MKIASAFKKPIVAMYSNMTTYIYEWMPYQVPFEALIAPDKQEIMAIPLEDVVVAFEKLWIATQNPINEKNQI